METNFKYFTLLICLYFLQAMNYVYAQPNASGKYDIYYLAVGSGHYQYLSKEKNPLEAVNSAHQMALNIEKIGKVVGNELLSSQDSLITKSKLLDKIIELKKTILRDKPKNPLIIFYFMGHGIGDNDGHHFITFGDYDFKMKKLSDYNNEYFKSLLYIDELAINFYSFDLDGNNNFNKPDKPLFDKKFVPDLVINMVDNAKYMSGVGKNKKIPPKVKNGEYGISIDGSRIIDKNILDPNNPSYRLMTEQMKAEHLSGQEPIRKEDLRKRQKELKLRGKSDRNNVNSIIVERENFGRHVPYLIIIDSCSNGFIGMSDTLLENREDTKARVKNKLEKQYQDEIKKLDSIQDKALKDRLIKNYEAQYKKGREIQDHYIDSQIMTAGLGAETIGAMMRAATFKKNGALFFAANPGETTFAFDSNDYRKNTEKVGKLAKRFELAVSQAIISQKNVSLGDFIKTFSTIKPDSGEGRPVEIPKPFSWFDIPPSLSESILIEKLN